MKRSVFLCFCLLIGTGFLSGLYAAGNQASPRFQWNWATGIERQWQGWDICFGGQITVDAIAYDRDNRKDNGLRWETLNLTISGNYGDWFDFFVEPDLLGIDTKNNLFEAWAGWRITPDLHLRAGQVKVALNSELATRPENFPCLDYGFSSYLDGRYDLGLQADGEVLNRAAWFEATVTAGAGFDLDGNRRSDPLLAIRTVVFPAQFIGLNFLSGWFAGLGVSWSPDYDDNFFVQTPLRSTVFTTGNLHGDEYRSRHFEAGWYKGPFRIGAERVLAKIEDFDQITSWSAYASWNITGETMRWERGGWQPSSRQSGGKGSLRLPGCLELAFRYSNADIDRALFDTGLTTYDPSTQEVRTATANLNWYPRAGLQITAGWIKTIADHELTTLGGTNRDSSYLLRARLVI